MGDGEFQGYKVVVAVEGPWRGAVYRTQRDTSRHRFEGPSGFLEALLDVTGWPLDGVTRAAEEGTASNGQR